jgi:hypothetical protein
MSRVLPRSERKVSETTSKAGMIGGRPRRGRVAQSKKGLQSGSDRRRGEQPPAHGLQVVHVRQEVQRRHHAQTFEPGGDAREDRAEGGTARICQELPVLLGLEVLALDELERGVVGQVAAGPAQLEAAHGLIAVRAEQAGRRHEVPPELDGGLAQAAQAQLVIETGIAVGNAFDLCREVVRNERDHRHAIGALERDDVVEALFALLVELFAGGRHHASPPVHCAVRLSAAATSLPQPSAPV